MILLALYFGTSACHLSLYSLNFLLENNDPLLGLLDADELMVSFD